MAPSGRGWMQHLEEDDYKHLGTMEANNINHGNIKTAIVKVYTRRLENTSEGKAKFGKHCQGYQYVSCIFLQIWSGSFWILYDEWIEASWQESQQADHHVQRSASKTVLEQQWDRVDEPEEIYGNQQHSTNKIWRNSHLMWQRGI